MSQTERADYKFVVKEGVPRTAGGEAPTSLMCEPLTRELSIVGEQGFLMIELTEGTTWEQASEVASYLQRHVAGLSFTRF